MEHTRLGPLMIDLVGTTISPQERELLQSPQVCGVILFARQFESKAQIRQLVAELHALREPRLLIAVDHEGGRVQRFRNEFTRIPPMRSIGLLYKSEPERARQLAYACGFIIGLELSEIGIDLNFGPVLDLDHPESNVIGDRSFNTDPKIAALLANDVMQGMKNAGMAAVGKHFPGHGGVKEDSHLECPFDLRSYAELKEADLKVFTDLFAAQLPAIMTAHILFSKIDTVPVTYSNIWLHDILRAQLHYKGIVFSDDLTMKAVAEGSYFQRVERALKAGCDITLVCNAGDKLAELFKELSKHNLPDVTEKVKSLYAHSKPRDIVKTEKSYALLADFMAENQNLDKTYTA
jgi:beta-N-acetylhexosaminidase